MTKKITLLVFCLIAGNLMLFGQGTPDKNSTTIVEDTSNAMLKLKSDNYLSTDTATLKFTNMSSGGIGTEFLIESIGEGGLKFRSVSDLFSNTSDSILLLQPDGDIYLGSFKGAGLGTRTLGVDEFGRIIAGAGTGSSVWTQTGTNISYTGGNVFVGNVPTSSFTEQFNVANNMSLGSNSYISFVDEDTLEAYLYFNGIDFELDNNQSGGDLILDGDTDIRFETANSGRMVLTQNGSLGIGTGAPTTGYLLDVNGWSKTNLLRVGGNTDGSAWITGLSGNLIQRAGTSVLGVGNGDLVGLGDIPEHDIDLTHRGSSGTSDDSGVYIVNPIANDCKMWVSNASGRLEFYSNDNLRAYMNASNGNWTPFSDSRLKTNIQSLGEGHLSKILQMRPVSYQIKNQQAERITYGLIAQEIYTLYPEIVDLPERDDFSYYGLSYTELIPILIAGTQEQQQQIEALKKENNELMTEMEQLKNDMEAMKKSIEKLQNK